MGYECGQQAMEPGRIRLEVARGTLQVRKREVDNGEARRELQPSSKNRQTPVQMWLKKRDSPKIFKFSTFFKNKFRVVHASSHCTQCSQTSIDSFRHPSQRKLVYRMSALQFYYTKRQFSILSLELQNTTSALFNQPDRIF